VEADASAGVWDGGDGGAMDWPEAGCATADRVPTARIAAVTDHLSKLIETPKRKVSHARETGSKAKTTAFRADRTLN